MPTKMFCLLTSWMRWSLLIDYWQSCHPSHSRIQHLGHSFAQSILAPLIFPDWSSWRPAIHPSQHSSFVLSHTVSLNFHLCHCFTSAYRCLFSVLCAFVYRHMRWAPDHPAFSLWLYPPLSHLMCSSTSSPLALLSVGFNLHLSMKPEEAVV